MNLLDRYIFRSVLFTCIAAVALFSFVVALPNVVRELLGPLLAGQISMPAFARLLALLLPFAISFALPMGILTGVLLTLGRLSADSEITAMRASGLSVLRVARPVFVLAALGATVALYINLESAPWARAQFYRELSAAVRTNPLSFIVPKTFIRDFKGCVIYVSSREGNVIRDIWFWRLDGQGRVTSMERSALGTVDYEEESNSIRLVLTPAQYETRNEENPEDFSKAPLVAQVAMLRPEPISLDRYLSQHSIRMKQDWLTFDQLRAEQQRLASAPPPAPEKQRERATAVMKLSVILHEKFNLSLAVFSFALVGVPLGIKVSRRETSANLGLALALVLSFYMLTVAVKWLEKRPEVHPDLLLWAPNLIFIGLGAWLFSRIDRR